MAEFNGRHLMLERNRAWDSHFAAQQQEAHDAWQQREQRRRYDEAARLTRAEGERQRQFYQNNAGLFTDSALGDMSPNVTAPVTAAQPNAGLAVGNVGAAAAAAAPVNTPIPVQARPQQVGSLNDEALGIMTPPTPWDESRFTGMNASQRSALSTYRNMFERTVNRRVTTTQPLARSLDALVRTGLISQQEANTELARASRYAGLSPRNPTTLNVTDEYTNSVNESVRAANPGVDFTGTEWAGPASEQSPQQSGPGLAAAGSNTAANLAGGPSDVAGLDTSAPASDDAYYQGINDTSRPLQATREMRLARAAIENDLQRAQLYAQHGQPDMAAEAFARSLQGQANMITMERMVLYRAAANGSNQAAQRLIEEYNGYPRGTVRLRTTNERRPRFQIEIQGQDGSWVPGTETPLGREAMLSSLLNLVDAEGAAARSEANQNYLETLMDNQTRLTIAGIEAQTAQLRMFTDVQIEQMSNEAAAAIQSGRATVVNNEETGTTDLYFPRYANGQVYWEIERVSTERQRSPDTNSRREIDVPVRTRITGNVGAN